MNFCGFLDVAMPAWLLAEGQNQDGGLLPMLTGPWLPFIVIGVLFYMMLIRPERRKRAEMSALLDNLKKNDHVVTIGGIHGVVVNAPKGSADITLRVDESTNTRIRVLRSAVSRVVSADEGEEKNDSP